MGTLASAIAVVIAKKGDIKAIRIYYTYEYVEDYWTPDGACIDTYLLIGTDSGIIHF